ncbi:hypothetical protein LEP1GSC166_2788 [Leptospira kirschneri]|nr:hypothetical protein LEP1GSC198_0027 [Leptospira kirschneri str. JB]EMK04545.1 hypothetical protein LEP1GSC166_2788 [Leptospira kirschneri]
MNLKITFLLNVIDFSLKIRLISHENVERNLSSLLNKNL